MRRFRTRRFSADMAEDDPLTLVPNIFDLAIVLAVAFLLSALGSGSVRKAIEKQQRRDADP